VVRLPFDSGPLDQSRDRRDGPQADSKTVAEKVRAFQEKAGPFGNLVLAMPDWEYNHLGEENSMKLLANEVLPLLNKGVTVNLAVA
jgi:hypothetical protein